MAERNNKEFAPELDLDNLDSASGGAGSDGSAPKFECGSLVKLTSNSHDAYRVMEVTREAGGFFYDIKVAKDFSDWIYNVPEGDLSQY